MYEYTSEVFAVGLDGFAPPDNDKITVMAGDGWEPTLITTVHNGFAALVVFRRESQRRRRVPPAKVAAPSARAKARAPAAKPAAPVRGTRRR